MPTNPQASEQPLELEGHFGDNAPDAQRLLDTLAAAPTRVWRADEIIAAAGITSIMAGMMILARLTHVGMIDHPDLGVYQAMCSSVSELRRPA